MENELTKEKLIELRDGMEIKTKEVMNQAIDAIVKKDLNAYTKNFALLKTYVQALNNHMRYVQYAELAEDDKPVIAAVKKFFVEQYIITEEKDDHDGSIKTLSLTKKNARIDLEEFCKCAELDTTWCDDCTKLLELLTLRETDIYNVSPDELSKKSFYFIAAARKKQNGETPDSNTQIVKLLQKIIDEAIFVDNGNGENIHKCTNHDLAFIQDSITKMNTKEKCTITMLKPRQFKNVMMGVFAHCLGEKYSVQSGMRQKNIPTIAGKK